MGSYTMMYCQEIDKFLDVIYEADEFWTTVEGAPSLHGESTVNVDTNDDIPHLNDLSVTCPTEPEYFDGCFLLYDPML